MNYLNIIFTALLSISVILHLVFSIQLIKGNQKKYVYIIARISSLFELPLTCGLAISFLVNFYPDSLHIIKMITFSYIFALACNMVSLLKLPHSVILTQIFWLISNFFWMLLYSNIFRLQHIPVWTLLLPAILFIISYLLAFFMIKNQKISFYFNLALAILITTLLIYTSGLNLFYYKDAASLIMLINSIILHAFTIFTIKVRNVSKNIMWIVINHYGFLLIQILFSLSSILMLV
ncbi:MAG: hypothetical protein K5866_10100 [Treponema sp.]|nr:hypothetical protein [Treponema sp.]